MQETIAEQHAQLEQAREAVGHLQEEVDVQVSTMPSTSPQLASHVGMVLVPDAQQQGLEWP